ncbi:MAG: ArsR/SmtB family transcription factor [Planctomycetota bacterium]
MSRALKAVNDAHRIRILAILAGGEHCVSQLVAQLGVDQPKVSHHLAILREAGFIQGLRAGRHIRYSMKPATHQRISTSHGPIDILDLGDVTVTFRFDCAERGVPAATSGVQVERIPARTAVSQHRLAEGASGSS